MDTYSHELALFGLTSILAVHTAAAFPLIATTFDLPLAASLALAPSVGGRQSLPQSGKTKTYCNRDSFPRGGRASGVRLRGWSCAFTEVTIRFVLLVKVSALTQWHVIATAFIASEKFNVGAIEVSRRKLARISTLDQTRIDIG